MLVQGITLGPLLIHVEMQNVITALGDEIEFEGRINTVVELGFKMGALWEKIGCGSVAGALLCSRLWKCKTGKNWAAGCAAGKAGGAAVGPKWISSL